MSLATDTLARQRAIQARCVHPSNTFVEFPKEAIEQSIAARFEEQVRRYPERLAVKTRSQALTYEALNTAANQVAHALLELRGVRPEPVGLLFPNGAPFVVASLGVAKIGKIQVPLDPTLPRARLTAMMEHSQASLIVTDNRNLALAQELAGARLPVINVEAIDGRLPTANPGLPLSAEMWSAIDYTSGSTGEPKGLVRSYRFVLHSIMRHNNTIRLCPHDRLAFPRATSRALLYPLLNGAAFYPFDRRQEELAHLAEWLIQEEVTIFRSAASVFREFAGALTREAEFPHLRMIVLFGEPVYHTDVELCRKHFSDHCILATSLGCSELGDYTYFLVDKATQIPSGPLPGGYPVEGMEVRILDQDGRRVDGSEIGEIAVRSPSGGVGYWRRPDLTQAAFLADTEGGEERVYRTGDLGRMLPDGCLFHLGRKDFQVKIRGHRVETTAVEQALLDLDAVKEAVVVGREVGEEHVGREADRAGGQAPGTRDVRLVAYLVLSGACVPTVTELRRCLAAKLSDYMLPSAFVVLDALPLTVSGKVDRRALPPPGRARPDLGTAFVAPRTAVEELLAGIRGNLLALDTVGVHDPFLDLGGHSLLAAQMLSRVQEAFRCEVALRVLFDAPTVAGLAGALVASEREPGGTERMARVRQRIDQMSAEEVQAALHQRQAERGAII